MDFDFTCVDVSGDGWVIAGGFLVLRGVLYLLDRTGRGGPVADLLGRLLGGAKERSK